MWNFIKELVLNVIGGALSVAIAAAVGILVSRIWGFRPPSRKERNLNGLWLAQFTYNVEGNKINKLHIIQYRHYVNHVKAKYLSGDSPPYGIDARLHFTQYISGIWDNDDINDEVHGAFIIVLPQGDRGTIVE